MAGANMEQLTDAAATWSPLVPQSPLQPHTRHAFDVPGNTAAATHVRLSIYPDGGIARMRVVGRVT